MNQPEPSGRGGMCRLAALNIALLALLAVVTVAARAERGPQPAVRGRGDYTMVGGKIQGGTGSCVYVLDAANQQLIAVRWNDTRKTLEGIDYRNVARDVGANAGQVR